MGVVQSNLNKREKNCIVEHLNPSTVLKEKDNMNQNVKRKDVPLSSNHNFKFFSRNRFNLKAKNDKPTKRVQPNDPKRTANLKETTNSRSGNTNNVVEKPDEYFPLFRWTPSSGFDDDLVSSFEKLVSIKSVSFDTPMVSSRRSDRFKTITRMGSDIISNLKRTLTPSISECQNIPEHNQSPTQTPKNEKLEQMSLDAFSSITSSTNYSDDVSIHSETSSTNGQPTNSPQAVIFTEEKIDMTPSKHGQVVDHQQNVNLRQREEQTLRYRDEVAQKREVETSIHEHKVTCIPPCFRINAKSEKELIEKPSYNSLCTKCMHKEDKIPKGFKGMILQLPTRGTEGKPREKSPLLNRSKIIPQTALTGGTSIHDVYEIKSEKLGNGSYGNVLKGVHKESGAVRAIKIILKSKIENAMRMKREIQIM